MNEMYTGGASGTLLRWARGPLIMTVMIDKKVEPTEFERIVEVDCLVNRDERTRWCGNVAGSTSPVSAVGLADQDEKVPVGRLHHVKVALADA